MKKFKWLSLLTSSGTSTWDSTKRLERHLKKISVCTSLAYMYVVANNIKRKSSRSI